MIGRTLSHYRIVEQIAAGGMGVVHRARDERLGRDVALKVLPPGALSDEAARERFRREALALSRLNHPHIATIYDLDRQEDVDFLVMEYIPGRTVARTALYSLGVVLYGMTAGKLPFEESLAPALIDAICHRDPVPPSRWNPAVSSLTDRIVLRLLEKNPERRYPSAGELNVDL